MWQLKAANGPEECPGVSPDELALIMSERADEVALADRIPWGRILREPAVWAIVIAHLCNNFGFYIILLWLPSYLTRTFAVPMATPWRFLGDSVDRCLHHAEQQRMVRRRPA